MKAKIPVVWNTHELDFIRDNYYTMTWKQLISAINANRHTQLDAGAIRHQCRRMGLAKQIQIRWVKEDIQFLIENYKTMGNLEIAEILSQKGRSFRMIEGKKVTRIFVPKNIEKKMELLKLERSQEDLDFIRKHNRTIGKGYCWTKENNVYTLGHKQLFDEGTIRLWGKDRKYKYIKINGKYRQYSRYQYEKFIGEIPKGYNVWFKDGDAQNCSPENLYLVSDQDQTLERKIRKYTEGYRELLTLSSLLNRQIRKITNK